MKILPRLHRLPNRTAIVIAITILISASPLLQAQPDPDRPDRPDRPAGEGRPGQRPQQGFQPGGQPGGRGQAGFRGGQGLPMLEQVLTDDQRDSLRPVLEAQREKMRGLQEKIRDARKAMMVAAFAEDYKEDAVRAKAMEVAKLEADMTVMRLKAIAEVQPALSKEQIEKITNPQPPQGSAPGDDGQRPNRRMNGPRDGAGLPQPPKRDPQ